MPNASTAHHRPRQRLFASLNTRLLLLVLLTLLPTAGLISYLGVTARQWILKDTEDQLMRLSRLGASRLIQQIDATHQALASWSELPQIRDVEAASCQPLFARLLMRSPLFANVGWIRPDGEIMCSGLPLTSATNVRDRVYFRRAVETRQFAVGQYQIGRVTGKATVNFGYPLVTDAGDVRGVLFAALDLSWLQQLAVEMQLPIGGRLSAVTNEGSVLFSYPDPEGWSGRSVSQLPLVQTILKRGEGVTQAVGWDGTAQLAAFTPVGLSTANPGLYLVISLPADGVFGKADWALTQTLLWLGLVGCLALLGARFMSERLILHPVRTLVRVSQQWARGDLTARTGLPHGAGELNELAQAFDEMAITLAQRTAEHQRMAHDIARLAAFPELYPHAVIEVDAAGLITYRNPAARAQYPDLPALGFEHPVLRGLETAVEELRQHRQPFLLRELALGDRVYEQQVYAIPESTRLHIYVLDITARKQAEAELQDTYRQLKETQTQLIQSEKLACIGQLAAGIAHELKNPLSIILQGVDILEHAAEVAPEQQAEALTMTKRSVLRADAIIRGLLTFSRQTSSQLQPVNLNDVLIAALALVEKQLTVNNVTVVKALGPSSLPVSADANQMQQVLINLMVNAMQAMPKGGRITLTTAAQTLSVLGHGVGRSAADFFTIGQRTAICEVADTGMGIPAEQLFKVFDPFFTTKPPGEGTGLGLSIVQSIVDTHRGLINIESEVGRGTTVRITLPLTGEAGAA